MLNRHYISVIGLFLGIVYSLSGFSQSITKTYDPNLSTTSIDFTDLEKQSKTLTFEIPEISIHDVAENRQLFHDIEIPGSGQTTKVGYPKLPRFTRFIEVPAGKELAIEIKSIETEHIPAIRPLPYQKPLNRNDYLDGVKGVFEMDQDFYQGQNSYPQSFVNLGKTHYLASTRITDLFINAVRFNPEDNSIDVITRLEVEIRFVRAKDDKKQRFIGENSAIRKVSKALVESYDNHSRGSEDRNPPQMLIITHDDFANSIQPFAQWKNKQGIKTRLVKLSDLSNKRQPEDIRELIASFLSDSTNMEGLEYVLLVGDIDYIPAFHGVYNALNDHTYATMNDSDYLPDLIVGRFSVNSVEECDVYVNKSINYERHISVNDSDNWFSQAVSAASNAHLDDMHGQHVSYEFSKNGFTHVDNLRASQQNFTNYHITNALNDGRSWLFYIGHGNETSWLTAGTFTRNTISKNLSYSDMMPAIISVACQNADLDFEYGNSFAERFMNVGEDKGAAVFLGATELTPFFLSDTLGKYALFSYLNDEVETFGEAMVYGKMKMYEAFTDNSPNSETKETMQHFLILGDPTIMPYTQKPRSITSNRLTQFKPGFIDFHMLVEADGEILPNALVSVSNEDFSIHEIAYTDDNGEVNLSFYAADTGKLSLVITAKNTIAYEGSIKITNYLSVDDEQAGSLEVWPNPFSNEINIIVSDAAPIQSLELFDVSGKILFKQENIHASKFLLTPPALNKGVYLLKITDTNGAVSMQKLSH
jgi:hypothetical protein